MNSGPAGEILAAGAVLYRHAAGGIEVALIHRERHDDWTFAKGKLERGEHVIAAAVREVTEETGIRPVLGRPLATVRYQVEGRPKRVDYWAALVATQSPAAPFVPNDEVDALEWLPSPEAFRRLTYAHDLRLLDLLLAPYGRLGLPSDNGAPPGADDSSITDEGDPGGVRGVLQADGISSITDGGDPGGVRGVLQADGISSITDGGDPGGVRGALQADGISSITDGGDPGAVRGALQADGISSITDGGDPGAVRGALQADGISSITDGGDPGATRGALQADDITAGVVDSGDPLTGSGLAGVDTVPCILLRHASAGRKSAWPGDDLLRPLDGQGLADAQALAGLLACYAPARVISSAAERCQATVRPYAELIGAAIETEPAFTVQPGDGDDLHAAAQRRMTELAAHPSPMVICAHRENISLLLEQARATLPTLPSLAGPTPSPDDPAWQDVEPHNSSMAADWSPPKGGFWVLHIASGQLSALEHHDLTS